MSKQQELRESITNQIIAAIETGTLPWRRPWSISANAGAPCNATNRRLYRGVNPFVLQLSADRQGFKSRFWATFRQWQSIGCSVMKGQHGTRVTFSTPITKTTTDNKGEEQEDKFWILRALANVRVESVRHFFNLATVQIRRELLDLAKHYFGPEGKGANHHTDEIPSDDAGGTIYDRAGRPSDPLGWCDFHAAVERLPEDEQEIVNLLFYEGLTHEEASRVLDTSVRTLKRRWASVKVKLHEVLNLDGQR